MRQDHSNTTGQKRTPAIQGWWFFTSSQETRGAKQQLTRQRFTSGLEPQENAHGGQWWWGVGVNCQEQLYAKVCMNVCSHIHFFFFFWETVQSFPSAFLKQTNKQKPQKHSKTQNVWMNSNLRHSHSTNNIYSSNMTDWVLDTKNMATDEKSGFRQLSGTKQNNVRNYK